MSQVLKPKRVSKKPKAQFEGMLTTREVARLLHLHISTVRRWSNQGLLTAYRVSTRGDRRFKREDVDALISEEPMHILCRPIRKMPRFTGEQLKHMFIKDQKGISQMLGAMLRDLGYPNTTDEAVEKEINAQLQGAEPGNLTYALWIHRYLKEGVD